MWIGKKVIEFKDVSFAFENKSILQDFNLLVQNKDRIGIVGDNVKIDPCNLIAERLQPRAGRLSLGNSAVACSLWLVKLMELDGSSAWLISQGICWEVEPNTLDDFDCWSLGAISLPVPCTGTWLKNSPMVRRSLLLPKTLDLEKPLVVFSSGKAD